MTTSILLLARGLYLASGLILLGVVAFRWLVLRPALCAQTGERCQTVPEVFAGLHRVFLGAGLVLAVSSVVLFWAVAADMSGQSLAECLNRETLGTVLFQTQFGFVCQCRLGLLILLLLLLGWAGYRWPIARSHPWLEILVGAVTAGLVLSFSFTGHAAAASGPTAPWRLVIDGSHLLAAAVWPAGLLPFALFLHGSRRMADQVSIVPTLRVVHRFSTLSLFIVIALSATGILNSYFLVGSIGALFATTYGLILCVKLGLFCIILGVAAWNRFCSVPLLRREKNPHAFCRLLGVLQNLVLIEFILALGIVAVVSLLGMTPPAR